MKIFDVNDLPNDPSEAGWTAAEDHGGGPVWVQRVIEPFQLGGVTLQSGWIVWDEHNRYRTVDEAAFEADYRLGSGESTADAEQADA